MITTKYANAVGKRVFLSSPRGYSASGNKVVFEPERFPTQGFLVSKCIQIKMFLRVRAGLNRENLVIKNNCFKPKMFLRVRRNLGEPDNES